jgi:hypothetical protein
MLATHPANLILLIMIKLVIFDEEDELRSLLCSFLHPSYFLSWVQLHLQSFFRTLPLSITVGRDTLGVREPQLDNPCIGSNVTASDTHGYNDKLCFSCVGLEFLTPVVIKSSVFWDMTPCSPLKTNRRFGGTCRLHLQGRRIQQNSACYLLHTDFLLGLFFDSEDGDDMFL